MITKVVGWLAVVGFFRNLVVATSHLTKAHHIGWLGGELVNQLVGWLVALTTRWLAVADPTKCDVPRHLGHDQRGQREGPFVAPECMLYVCRLSFLNLSLPLSFFQLGNALPDFRSL